MTSVALGVLCVVIILLAFSDLRKALFLFTILIPFTGYLPALDIKGLNFLTVVVVVLFIAVSRVSGRFFPPSPINKALGLLTAITLFSWLVTAIFPPSPPRYEFAPRWMALAELTNIKRWIIFIPIYFIYVNGTRNEKDSRFLIKAVVWGVGLQSLQVLKEYLLAGHGRVYGSFGNPNEMGAFMTAYLPLIGIFLYQAHFMIERILYSGIGFLALFGLVYSQSRGGYLSFASSVMIFSFMKSRFLFMSLLAALVLTVTVSYTWLPDVVVDRIDFTFNKAHFNKNFEGVAGQFEGSAASRLVLAQGALRMFSESPIIGKGIGTLQYTIGNYMADLGYDKNVVAHNMYLQILVELGLIGFLPFIYILYRSGKAGYQLYRTGMDTYMRNIGIAFFCCVCALAVSNLFGNRFFRISLTGYYWVLAAMVFNRLNEISLVLKTKSNSGARHSGEAIEAALAR